MTGNGQPLSMRKKIRLLLGLTFLAWATQTLLQQWGYGAEAPASGAAPIVVPAWTPEARHADEQPQLAAERFVPGTPRFAAGATLELRAEARIYGPEVKLKQICRWADVDADMFLPVADLIVARFDGKAPFRAVSIADIKSTLHDAGVNLAVVRFAGPNDCTITRSDATPDPKNALENWIDAREGKVAPAEAAAPVVAAPSTRPSTVGAVVAQAAPVAADASPVRSLRQALVADLSARLNLPVEMLQLHFNPKDDRILNLSEPAFRFNLEPVRARNLGEVSWEVTVVHESGTQKVQVGATARAWQTQAVVSKPVSARQIIRSDDVTEKRTLIDRLTDEPLLSVAQAVGQQAGRDIKPGTVLTGRMVDAVPLAKTGQFITITLDRGGIRIKTVGRAMEGGSFGQSIKVKNEATNDVYDVVLSGPQEGTIGQSAGATTMPRVASVRD